jgi:hypothetical protein
MPRFACVECNKKFDSEGAMRMHEADKHGRKRLVPPATPKARVGFVGTFCAAFLGPSARWASWPVRLRSRTRSSPEPRR